MKIRASVLDGMGTATRVEELDLAEPHAEEVLVRIGASGVCRSDYNAVDGTTSSEWPVVLGHEGAGVVEAVGERVTRVKPGDHVTLSWTPSCGECSECLRDLPQMCSTIWPLMGAGGLFDETSRLSLNGQTVYHYCFLSTFAEATVVPERACVPIPKDVPFDVASLVGCAVTTGVGAVWNTAGVRPGDRVAIIGCGGVGLSALMAAVAVGADPVIAVDASQAKVDTALSFGASAGVVWAGSAEATAEAVREVSGGGVDYAIEATGRGEAMLAAVLSTRTRGAAVLIGIPRAETVIPLPALTIPRMERRVLGLDLWLGAAGARLRQDPRRVPLWAPAARPARLAPAPARAGGRRLRAHELGRGVARRPRPHDGSDRRRSSMNLEELDGRIGEGWGGLSPNGAHVNVVLAHRGSPTAAAAISMFAHPSPGHSPVLCCVGRSQPEYQPIWPPTLMMNKTTANTPNIEKMTWGPGQLGIGQAVLDAVADGLIEATGDLIVLVALWIDGRADDETAGPRRDPLRRCARRSGCASRGVTLPPPRSSSPTVTRSGTRSTAGSSRERPARGAAVGAGVRHCLAVRTHTRGIASVDGHACARPCGRPPCLRAERRPDPAAEPTAA